MRVLIYTGKGGVGKTTVAAATALSLSEQGKKTILVSTDQAHSLRDAFGIQMDGAEAVRSDETCIMHLADGTGPDLLELNTRAESRRVWGNLQDYLREIIVQKAGDELAAEEAMVFPGAEELFSLLRILELYESGSYEVIVVDCAPTGETLSLLRYPERLKVLADRVLPMVRNVNRAFGSLISRKTAVPKPRDIVFSEFEQLVKRLYQLQILLQDRDTTSIRLVMLPEQIVLEETLRSYTWLQLYDYGVDAVYINRIYPKRALDGFFSARKDPQEQCLKRVKSGFSAQRLFFTELMPEEIDGMDALRTFGRRLYGDTDPQEVYCREQAFRIEDIDPYKVLVVRLPYAEEEETEVQKDGKDLILRFRNETRTLRLPDRLERRFIHHCSFSEGELRIFMDYS